MLMLTDADLITITVSEPGDGRVRSVTFDVFISWQVASNIRQHLPWSGPGQTQWQATSGGGVAAAWPEWRCLCLSVYCLLEARAWFGATASAGKWPGSCRYEAGLHPASHPASGLCHKHNQEIHQGRVAASVGRGRIILRDKRALTTTETSRDQGPASPRQSPLSRILT